MTTTSFWQNLIVGVLASYSLCRLAMHFAPDLSRRLCGTLADACLRSSWRWLRSAGARIKPAAHASRPACGACNQCSTGVEKGEASQACHSTVRPVILVKRKIPPEH